MSIKTITDEKLLDMIIHGLLIVDLQTGAASYNSKLLKATIVGTAGMNGTRYRYEICLNGKKRSILRARLVWMAGSLKVIPKGHNIHHLDHNRYNDVWSNLICLSEEDHNKLHRYLEQRGLDDKPPF